MRIHPQYIENDGVRQFVVLPYDEFLRIQEVLEEYESNRLQREEKLAAPKEPIRTVEEILGDFR